MKSMLCLLFAAIVVAGFSSAPSDGYAQTDEATQSEESTSGSAMDQLEEAAQDGQEAVEAPTEEEAKEESNETFDTPHDSDGD